MSRPWLALVTCAGLGAASCVPSNVVAATDRSVRVEAETVEWRAATAEEIPGLWSSGPMTGALASALIKVVYHFEADGRFTGAALFAGPPSQFRVLDGEWAWLDDGRISLGEEVAPATLQAAGVDMLRMSGPDGSVVLYREVLR